MVSACAADPVKLPDFGIAERADVAVVYPTPLPLLCDIPFDTAECYVRLDVYDDIAHDNTELAQLNADIIKDSEAAYDLVLSAGKKQQEVGQIRQEMLEAERYDHFMDNLYHRIMLAILAIGLIL